MASVMRKFLLLAPLIVIAACKSSSGEVKPDEGEVSPAEQNPSNQGPAAEGEAGDRIRGGPQLHGMEGAPNLQKFEPEAAANLKKGDEALGDHNYDDAQKYFEYVRTRFPFEDSAKVAELKLADTEFARENWLDARDRYTNFVRAHPTHPMADYAAYRAALTHFKDGPTDLFILPPPYEKDLTEVAATLNDMRDFVRNYPDSKYLPQAHKAILACQELLAKHEMYVADFYAKRDHWAGSAGRLEALVTRYPQSSLAKDALVKLHDAYVHLKRPEDAKSALQRLIEAFPQSSEAKEAKKSLGS
jgi:outer membrane protein assembly factor BamD